MVAVEKVGTSPAVAVEDVTDELAWCLGRFLDATADESVMQRARKCLVLWESFRETGEREVDLTLVEH